MADSTPFKVDDLKSSRDFFEATKIRRSTTRIKNESVISDGQVEAIVKHAILHDPSPFSVQAVRAVILFQEEHTKFWEMAYQKIEATTPKEQFQSSFQRNLVGYKEGYGTVLFFDDPTAIDALPPQLGGLIKQFPEWLDQSNGMAQFIVWTGLCDSGLGCSLQHYHKWLGASLNEFAKVPAEWKGSAQLVFGTPTGPPRGGLEKEFAPLAPRVKSLGGNLN